MSIFSNAQNIALPFDPQNLEEGLVTGNISSGITFGSDPAKSVSSTVKNISGLNSNTVQNLGPNFDRFSVLSSPQAFGVTGNFFQSGQDLVPIADIASNFGGTFVGDELSRINVGNLIRNPGQEISTFARNLSSSVSNQAEQAGESIARSVVQDVKDVFRGAVNTLLNPSAAATTNLGVVDSRLSYAFFGPIDAHERYSKGLSLEKVSGDGQGERVGYQGVEPIVNPHYVFRLNSIANGTSAGEDSKAQSRLLLDKESRLGVSTIGKKEVTLSALLNKFGAFSKTNPTPYRAADFLWLKHYNRIPLTRLITLRRYMFPIQDNLTRSAYFGSSGKGVKGAYRVQGWGNNPVSQMVTYFGGESGNDLGTILKISVSSKWQGQNESNIQDVKLFQGAATGITSLFEASRVAKLGAGVASLAAGLATGGLSKALTGGGKGTFFNDIGDLTGSIKQAASKAGLNPEFFASGILAYANIIDKSRFSGIGSYLDTFNPYERGGYLSDLYREPYNVITSAQKRVPGLFGGVAETIQLKFEYSLKAIGHINAKAAMLDIMSNILATTHYRGNFWGGEARFYLNKGIFPLLSEEDTIKLVGLIWNGDFDSATTKFYEILQKSFGNQFKGADIVKFFTQLRNSNIQNPNKAKDSSSVDAAGGSQDTTATATAAMAGIGGLLPEQLKELTAIDLLSGLFNLTSGGNPAIPEFQALKTGAPVGEWHLTVGNPFKPIATLGNLICEGVEITFNNELGPDDFPTEMSATVTLKPGMPRANQDVESVFNDGFGPLYIPKPGITGTSKTLEQVQEEISKQVATSAIFDFTDAFSDSIAAPMSNFFKVPSNPDLTLPTPQISRTAPKNTNPAAVVSGTSIQRQ